MIEGIINFKKEDFTENIKSHLNAIKRLFVFQSGAGR
jgi:glycerol-3-phosphate responsive antiterminator